MNKLAAGGLIAAATLLLAACGSSSSNRDPVVEPPIQPPPALLQVVHASADAPAVNVLLNGEVALPAVPFAAASAFLPLDADAYDVAVNAIFPDDSEAQVLAAPGFALESEVAYTVIAAGSTADLLAGGDAGNPLRLFVLERSVVEAIAGARVQVLHGSPTAPAVDV
jgi:hypothetical protein